MRNIQTMLFMGAALMPTLPITGQTPSPGNPVKVAVGDGTFDGSFLKSYKNLWRLTYTKAGREPVVVASWSDEGELLQINGRPAMKRYATSGHCFHSHERVRPCDNGPRFT